MDKLKILLLSLVFPFSAFSQDWSLFNVNETLHYRHDTAGYISHSIHVDSFSTQGSDTVFHMNRVLTYCDTCTFALGGNWGGGTYALDNQPQFLQRHVRKYPDGRFLLHDPDSLWVHARAAAGTAWLYNPVTGDSAHVVAIDTLTLFGNPDSVKTIAVDNGDTLQLSRAHGLRKMLTDVTELYQLEGIAGRNLGTQLPTFDEFFDYTVGDVFEARWNRSECCPVYGEDYHVKFTITGKTVTTSGIEYNYTAVGNWRKHLGSSTSPTMFINTTSSIVFEDSVDHVANLLPGQGFRGDFRKHDLWTDTVNIYAVSWFYGFPADDYRMTSSYYLDGNGVVTKYIHGGRSQIFDIPIRLPNHPNIYELLQGPDLDQLVYKEGIGVVRHEAGRFESGYSWQLTGWIVNGVQTGIITEDSVLLARSTPGRMPSVTVFPNPTPGPVRIDLGQRYDTGTASLYDLSGKLVHAVPIQAQQWVDMTPQVPNGLYILQIKADGQVFQQKLTVRR